MRVPFTVGQIAKVVFGTLVPVASRTVTVSTNNDKTGYTLTAGGYSVRASSTQRGAISLVSVTSNTASPSEVTLTRAHANSNGCYNINEQMTMQARTQLTASTTMTSTRTSSSSAQTVGQWELEEFF